jgi:ABC-type multidrug transport system fused ATPase/permease subunit
MKILRRIHHLLQPNEHKKLLKIAVSVFFMALLDFASLAALLPILYLLLEEGKTNEAVFSFCILAVAVIVTKCILSTFLTKYQNRCLLSFYRRLSYSLFSAYYNKGLLFIREQGSNKLGHEINAMCYAFSHSLLAPICRMTGDALLIILVTIALLIWDGTTIVILYISFIPFMCIYFLAVRKRVREYGKEDMLAKREQARVVVDTFRGYVELEVNGAFPTLQKSFLEGMDKISNNRMKLDTLLRLPLFLSELSVVVGLAMLVAFGDGDIKILIGVFAVASFRLLPALRSILTGWTQIQNARCCLDTIEEGLKDYQEKEISFKQKIVFEKGIDVAQVTYGYPDGELVLKEFSCHIAKGEYVGFSGTSGVGKSTLFNLLTGLIEPISGKICIDGRVLTKELRPSWMQHIGYVPQEVFIFKGTLAENIALGSQEIDTEQIYQILKKVSLYSWVSTLPKGIDTPLSEAGGKLSGGQKQRIGIARALYKKVSVLLLDEATSALDNETEKEINQTLRQLKETNSGLTILSIAHRESSLNYCNRIIRIEKVDD